MSYLPPNNFDSLKAHVIKEYDFLSKRLKQVADFIFRNGFFVASENMQAIAKKSGVPLSTLSRFANSIGFSGFSEMQKIFKDKYFNRPRNYKSRIQQAKELNAFKEKSTSEIFEAFGQANLQAIDELMTQISSEKLEKAVSLMLSANKIYIQGTRRAYPVAFYFWYALMKSEKGVVFLEDFSGVVSPLFDKITSSDVLLVVSYTPHAEETINILEKSFEKNVNVICITDHMNLELSRNVGCTFEIKEGELMGFRSLSASFCLAQTLAISFMNKYVI